MNTGLDLLADYPHVCPRDASRVEDAVRDYASAVGLALGEPVSFSNALASLIAIASLGPVARRRGRLSPCELAMQLAEGGVN